MPRRPPSTTTEIRDLAHIDAGKTPVTERILYYTGKIHKIGKSPTCAGDKDGWSRVNERVITITRPRPLVWAPPPQHLRHPGHWTSIDVERSLRVSTARRRADGNQGLTPNRNRLAPARPLQRPARFVNKRTDRAVSTLLRSIRERLGPGRAEPMPSAGTSLRASSTWSHNAVVWATTVWARPIADERDPRRHEGLLRGARNFMSANGRTRYEAMDAYLGGE